MSSLTPYAQSALRIVAALSFVTHGTQKLVAMPVAQTRAPVEWWSQMGLAGALETVGGLLVLIGLFTRPVAFVLAGQMAWAYFQSHAPRGFWPILNGGELATLYCFLWLFFFAAGPGPISVDAWRHRPSRAKEGT